MGFHNKLRGRSVILCALHVSLSDVAVMRQAGVLKKISILFSNLLWNCLVFLSALSVLVVNFEKHA